MNDFLFSSSSSLLCFVCSSPFKDPRNLPCQHTYCLKCIQFLCDNPTSDPTIKVKLVCPQCTSQFTVPTQGVESYPVNQELNTLRSKIVDEVANNISKKIGIDKESSKAYNSSSNMSHEGYVPLNKEYSKYAKYLDSQTDQTNFKPTIRRDHAKVGYESSTRFRNRQRSKDRDKNDDYRRKTWYGSTLENRRAQSLSRSSTYTENTKNLQPENLGNIMEDKEQPVFNQTDSSSHRHSMYDNFINLSKNSSQFIEPSNSCESPYNRRANLGGPSRPALFTHRENLSTYEDSKNVRKNSRFSSSKEDCKKFSTNNKFSQNLFENMNTSPSPQRKKYSRLSEEPSNEYRFDNQDDKSKDKLNELNKVNDKHEIFPKNHSPSKEGSEPEVISDGSSTYKKQRGRCRSMDARPKSLNKSDFKSTSEFKNHLLGMTMKKDWYQNIMQDCLNNIQDYEDDEEDISFFEEAYMEENKENFEKRGTSVVDENLITTLRSKYSSSLSTKKSPRHTAVMELGAGVTQIWSYHKNDSSILSSAVFLSSGALVIADYGHSCLDFMNINGHFEYSVTGIKPFGMTINRKNNNVIVGDRKEKNIRIFDEFGADVSQIDDFNKTDWLGGISIRNDGNLVLCDRSKSQILVCIGSGESPLKFGSYGVNTKQLCMADFIAVDSKDRVIVADSGAVNFLNFEL